MSTQFHVPIVNGESNSPATINTRLSDLDAAIATGSSVLSDRIDDLIIDAGTSDAETLAARTAIRYGTAPATLGDALALVAARTLYVDAFGAVGDGVTNDATALAAVFTAAQPGDTIVFTPGKTYVCNTGLTAADAGLTLIGYGATLNTSALNSTALTIGAAEISIYGLTFVGEATTGTTETPSGKNSRAILNVGFAYLKVIDCRFEGYFRGGVHTGGSYGMIRGNTLVGVRHWDSIGLDHYGAIYIGGASHVHVQNNHLSEVFDAGISLYGANRCVVSGNTVICTTEAGGTGSMGIYGNVSIVGCSIAGNVISGAVNEGIMLGNNLPGTESYGNAIVGNTIADSNFTGITLRAGAGVTGNPSQNHNNTISGNTIRITTVPSALSCDYGIFLEGTDANSIVHTITVSGNTLYGTKDGAAYRLVRGIASNGEANAKLNYTGNTIDGASTGLYMTGSHVQAVGNMISNCNVSINFVFSLYGIATGNYVTASTTSSLLYDTGNVQALAFRNYIDKLPTGAPAAWHHNQMIGVVASGTQTLTGGTKFFTDAAFETANGSAIVELERISFSGTPGALYVSAINQAQNAIIVNSTSATDAGSFVWRLIR